MLNYFKAELLRFRAWAIAYFVLHLVVLGFLTRVVDLAQQPKFIYQCFAGVYALSGLLLGAYQMGTYRKPNAWLNLLHRPVAHRRLALALMAAAASLLLVAVLLPMLAIAGWQEGMTARVVDARHLWLLLSAWSIALCGYLAGAYALLANRRYSVAGAIFLFALCFLDASGLALILLQALIALWLGAMVLATFKPDLAATPRGAIGMAIVAVPLQLAMWVAMVMLGFGVEMVWIMQGSHPNNLPVPVPGSAKEANNFEGPELMAAGLQASRDPQSAIWREQAAISEVFTASPGLTELPIRHELTNLAPMEFDDDSRRVRWVFSHEDMLFHGYTQAEQRPAGTLGVLGQQPFAQPPLPIGEGLLVTGQAVYQYDEEVGRILPRARVPAGERLVGLDKVGARIAMLSRQALYLYDARDLQTSDGVLEPRWRVPMPGRIGKLSRVELMELVDGVLVSFTFTRGIHKDEGLKYQSVLRVDEQGVVTEVARRGLTSGYGPVYLYSRWYYSPVLYTLQERATRLFAGYQPEFDVDPAPVPRIALAIAGVLLALSMLLAIWRTRRIDATPMAKLAWISLSALVGVPALLALWLLYPPRESLDALPQAVPAPA